MYLNQTQLINLQIDIGAIESNSEAMLRLIDDDKAAKQPMYDGVNYYLADHTYIKEHDFRAYSADGTCEPNAIDYDASNNKIINPFFRLEVNQKVEVALSKSVTINIEPGTTQEQIVDTLGTNFDILLINYAKGSSQKGVEWVHPYINSKHEFKLQIADAREIIPVYNDADPEQLDLVFRYYYKTITLDGKSEEVLFVEVWYPTYYDEYKSVKGKLIKQNKNPLPHFNTRTENKATNEVAKNGTSWGRVPFIPLKNNYECTTDLQPIKSLIDDYDFNTSDMSNNLADIADAIWALSGYPRTKVNEFRRKLKTQKIIILDKEGKAESHTLDIPHEARDSQLNRLEKNIFLLGQAVNMGFDKLGSDLSGIVLELLFAGLIWKANAMIRHLESSLYDILWFQNRYYEISNELTGTGYATFDPKAATFTFNYDIPTNETEDIENVIKTMGIDPELALKKHPWIDSKNLKKVLARVLAKEAEATELIGVEDE